MKTAELSDGSVRLLAAACAIVAANAYYVHPIIGRIVQGASDSLVQVSAERFRSGC